MYTKKENKLLNLAFLGSRPISLEALEIVNQYTKKNPGKVKVSVLTSSDDNPPFGVSRWWHIGKLKNKAKKFGFELLMSTDDLINMQFDLVNMVFFNDIIPQNIINKVPRGITNIHFGYLPSDKYSPKFGSPKEGSGPYSKGTYRGSNILSHAILNGERWQAVTFHFITKKIDLGPIIEYAWNPIYKTTTSWDLQLASEKKALQLFNKYFPLLVENPNAIATINPGSLKYPYYNRSSLESVKILNKNIDKKKLELITRALAFPGSEPAYFLAENKQGRKFKKYVVYKNGKGVQILRTKEKKYTQKIFNIN